MWMEQSHQTLQTHRRYMEKIQLEVKKQKQESNESDWALLQVAVQRHDSSAAEAIVYERLRRFKPLDLLLIFSLRFERVLNISVVELKQPFQFCQLKNLGNC